MDLLPSYLITVPMKSKSADEVTMAYLKRVLPISLCNVYVLKTMELNSKINNWLILLKVWGSSQFTQAPITLMAMGNSKIPKTS